MPTLAVASCRMAIASASMFLQYLEILGACEAPVHRALKQYRLYNSEWFDIDLLTAVETIQEAQPQPQRTRRINLEAQALKHLKAHNTLTSSRYPHLNSSPA